MRRRPFALFLSLSTAITPMVSPIATGVLDRFQSPAAAVGLPRPALVGVPGAVLQSDVPALATELALIESARTRGLSVTQLRAAWQNVANCEVGGNWAMTGPIYSGIGFLNSTWIAFGGARYAPSAGRATRDQQILVAMQVTGGWIPDQNGCSAW